LADKLDQKMASVYHQTEVQEHDAAPKPDVQETLRTLRGDMRACCPPHIASKHHTLVGEPDKATVTVKVILDPAGLVTNAATVPERTTLEDRNGVACMLKAIRTTHFPRPIDDSERIMTLSFNLPGGHSAG